MRRSGIVASTGIMAAMVFGAVTPAAAADDLVIPVDSVITGQVPFSTIDVATVDVDADLVGDPCEVTLVGENNDSVHDGNHLIVSTGDDSVTFPNVESEAFQTTTAEGEVVLGETVLVQLQFGEDGISSGGLTLTFDCTEVAPTTTAAPTTTVAPTTTEVPAEVLAETQVASAQPEAAVQAETAAKLSVTG